MNIKPTIVKDIFSDGRVSLTIVLDNEVIGVFGADFSKPLSERQHLHVIQSAFQSGVEAAIAEMKHLLSNIDTSKISPSAKVSKVEKIDVTYNNDTQ